MDYSNFVSLYSVNATFGGRIYALVPGEPLKAVPRLRADDPIWMKNGVSFHWSHEVPSTTGVKPRDRINFKFVAA